MSSIVTLYGMKELQDGRASTYEVDWLDPKQNIGVEIEVEFDRDTVVSVADLNLWTQKSDGSLRRGQEYVLSRPMRGDALSAAIEEFFHHSRVHKSPTSGTHIHVDMRDKNSTLDVVKTMASIITCIEPAIFGMFAEGREWCGYTNPITSINDTAIYSVFSDKADDNAFRSEFSTVTREYKYYGFNMLPLGRYGSVEFRYFNTATTAEELTEWIQFCMAIKLAAVSVNTRANFKYYLQDEASWREFLSKYFPMWWDRMLEFLPHREVYIRHKQMRARANRMKKRLPANDENKLKNTRFKKFFAVKVKDPITGKSRLVYDVIGVSNSIPTRVFLSYDPVLNTYGFRKNQGDFLVAEDVVYKYDADRQLWLEIWSYNTARIITYYTHLTENEIGKFLRAVRERAGGSTPVEGTIACDSRWASRLTTLANLVAAYPYPNHTAIDDQMTDVLADYESSSPQDAE